MAMNTLYYQAPCQTTFKINTTCFHLIEQLYLQYGKYVTSQYVPWEKEISIWKKENSYLFVTKEHQYFTDNPLKEIDKFFYEQKRYDEDVFAIHGAAVECCGRAYLFLSPSKGGKSTLTSYLVNQGFGYITDDCVLLDKKDFRIYPCTNPVRLREGSKEILKKYDVNIPTILLDSPPIHRYIYNPVNCVTDAIPLGRIFFFSKDEGVNSLEIMDHTKSRIELIKSAMVAHQIDAQYLKFVARLSQEGCYFVRYSDMLFVKEVISRVSRNTEEQVLKKSGEV